jgi:hypothetical protein
VDSLLGRSSGNNGGSICRVALSEVGQALEVPSATRRVALTKVLSAPRGKRAQPENGAGSWCFPPSTTDHLPFLPSLLNRCQQSGLHLLREDGSPGRLIPAAGFHGGLQAFEICNAGALVRGNFMSPAPSHPTDTKPGRDGQVQDWCWCSVSEPVAQSNVLRLRLSLPTTKESVVFFGCTR